MDRKNTLSFDPSQYITGSTVGGLKIMGNPSDNSGLYVTKGAAKKPLFSTPTKTSDRMSDELKALLDRFDALDASLNQNISAPYLDVAGLNKRALGIAQTKVNPYFDEERNLFLKDVERRRGESQSEAEMLRAETESMLAEFLQDTDLTRTRTAEDVTGNISDIANAEDIFQTEEATQADQELTTVADAIADAGLTTSGIGKQKIAEMQAKRTGESKKTVQQLDAKKQEQIQFKSRTFEDVATGEKRKIASTDKEKEAIKFQLGKQLDSLAYEKVVGERRLEVQRKDELAREQSRQASSLFTGFIQSLGGNTQKVEAANRAYGGIF